MLYLLGKLSLGVIPLLLTPVWGYLIAIGHFNFGGGDKDLLLLIPWLAWALSYLVIFLAAWRKKKDTKTMVIYGISGATGLLLVAWVVLFIGFNWILGVDQS
jgi:hypothetical protein